VCSAGFVGFAMAIGLLAASAGSTPLTAQAVRVQVLDRSTRTGVVGAIVSIVGEDGSRKAAALSDERGRSILRGNLGTSVRIQAERIGYAASSTPLLTLSDTLLSVTIELSAQPLELPRIAVRERRPCDADPAAGTLTARLWDEVRKALSATILTASGGLELAIWRYTRTLDLSLRVLAESTSMRSATTEAPFVTAPPDELMREGFVRTVSGTPMYFAPDAGLLVSSSFVRAHCFGIRESRDGNALIGLAFEPVRGRSIGDVAGVLWVDRESGELRWMEYSYTGPPVAPGGARASGRLDFLALPSGAWIVERWFIRMPITALVQERRAGRLSAASRDSLMGFREEGGWVTMPRQAADPGGEGGTLVGVVFDSLRAAPLPNARVFLGGGSVETRTDSAGRYRLRSLLPGRYFVGADHPRLRTLGSGPMERAIVLQSATTETMDWAVASAATLRTRFCPGGVANYGPSRLIIAQVVHPATHIPVIGTRVSVSWGRVPTQTAGSPTMSVIAESTVVAQSDGSGMVMACGPATSDVRLWAELNGVRAERAMRASDTADVFDVSMALGPRAAPSSALRGRVVAPRGRDSKISIPAEILLPAGPRSVRTEPSGAFELRGLADGVHTVIVRSIGYAPLRTLITVPVPRDSIVEFQLHPLAKELAEVVVVGRATGIGRMRAFEERRATIAGGSFLTREDLAKRDDARLSDILRSVRGTRLQRQSDGSTFLMSPRGTLSLKVRDCYYQVYLDGVRIFAPGSTAVKPPNVDDFAPQGIEAIEIYTGPAITPPQFSGLGAACGTIVLWTRS
jgi:hypothetical protein